MSSAVDTEHLGGHGVHSRHTSYRCSANHAVNPLKGFSHGDNDEIEAEYDRLRGLARQEAQARGECFQRSQEAYNNGDGAAAKELSNEGKEHGAQMAEYNRQASEFIFRENNAPDRVEPDEIDLHGQFVEEAEDILLDRIKACQERGEDHIHVIVGRGIHSADHVQKIKPAVEKVCDQLGLQHRVEPNAGRIYVNLTGGPAEPLDEGAGGEQQQYRSPEAPQTRPQEHTEPEQQGESSSDDGFCKACCVVM